jgi:SAM-dependent methyltransferase
MTATQAHEPLADDWDRHWDELSAANTLNPAQHYRHRVALALTERCQTPQRLLDAGCGQGDLLLQASERWPEAELAGFDLSEQGVRTTARRVPVATAFQRDLLDGAHPAPELRGWASHAICSEVLEHVDDPVALVRGLREYLAPGCRLVVTVPGGRMSAFDRNIGHRQHFTPESVRAVLDGAGMRTVLAGRAGFPMFNLYRSMVIARGEKLVDDAVADGGRPSPALRAAMLAFGALFTLNLPRTPWGVQIVAVAYEPGAGVS